MPAEKIIQLFPDASEKEKKTPRTRPALHTSGLVPKHFRYKDAMGISRNKVVYGKTVTEALRKKEEFLAAVRQGLRMEEHGRTVASWADQWLEVYKRPNVTIRTFETYKHDIDLIKKHIGDMPLVAVQQMHLQSIINSRAGLSSSAIKKTAMTIKALFASAVENRIINASPAVGVKPIKGTTGSHRDLTDEEIQAVLSVIQSGHRFAAMAALMLFAGLRPSEAAALRFDRDIDSAHIIVREAITWPSNQPVVKPPKSSAGYRTIPIFEPLRAVLESVNTLYSMGNSPPSERARNCAFAQFKAMSGVDFSMGDLRTTFATMIYDAGVDVKTAQAWLGHGDPSVTMRFYVKMSQRRAPKTSALAQSFFAQYK